MDSGKCKLFSIFFSFFFALPDIPTGNRIPFSLNPGGETSRCRHSVPRRSQNLMSARRTYLPNRHESLKKIPGPAGEPGRKYRIELSPNYFLYLIAVPISLTVTVLIPQMQFIL